LYNFVRVKTFLLKLELVFLALKAPINT